MSKNYSAFVLDDVDLCKYIILNVYNNVQTREFCQLIKVTSFACLSL